MVNPLKQPSEDTNISHLMFVGVLPGPKNGMTLFSQRMLEAFQTSFNVTIIDLGRGYSSGGMKWKISKALSTVRSIFDIWFWGQKLNGHSQIKSVVYLVGNSSGALLLSAAQALAARIRGLPVVYHHHTFISIWDWRMKWVLRALGPEATHVMAGQELSDHLCLRSGYQPKVALLKPSLISATKKLAIEPEMLVSKIGQTDQKFVIGHLSNLTNEKGLSDVIETVELLLESGLPVKAMIAGPFANAEAEQIADEASRRLGETIEFIGPLYGVEKATFLADLDVFLFPSRYPNESWAMVIDEALAASVPVISTSFPCSGRIATEDNSPPGYIIPLADNFAPHAVTIIQNWINHPARYKRATSAARNLAVSLKIEAKKELADLISNIKRGS